MNTSSGERQVSLLWNEGKFSGKRGNLGIPGIETHNPWNVCHHLFPVRNVVLTSQGEKDPVEASLGRKKVIRGLQELVQLSRVQKSPDNLRSYLGNDHKKKVSVFSAFYRRALQYPRVPASSFLPNLRVRFTPQVVWAQVWCLFLFSTTDSLWCPHPRPEIKPRGRTYSPL